MSTFCHPAANLLFTKANVMIDQNGLARLADFGLLTFVSDPTNPTNSSSVTNAGTTRWMSPELLHPEHFGFSQSRPTKKSDCYALGMVVLEVLSGEPPFARDKDFIVMRKVIEGERPERPDGILWFTDNLWRTLEQCWSPQPNDRPTIEAVFKAFGPVSSSWEPFPPLAEDADSDGDGSVSTTSQSDPFLSSQTPYVRQPPQQPMYASAPSYAFDGIPRATQYESGGTSSVPSYGFNGNPMSTQYVSGGTTGITPDPYGYSRSRHRRHRRYTYGNY